MVSGQAIVAGALVLASAMYATWRLLTPRQRLALLGWLATAVPGDAGRWLARVRDEAARSTADGCQACAAGRIRRPPSAQTRTPAAPRR